MTGRRMGICGNAGDAADGAGAGRGMRNGCGAGGGQGRGAGRGMRNGYGASGGQGRGVGPGRGLEWFSVGYDGVGYEGVGREGVKSAPAGIKDALETRARMLRAELARTEDLLKNSDTREVEKGAAGTEGESGA
jgi:hypothetical protein